ncbi:metal-dependent hydrolase [Cohnella sp. GCM10027633]|uniref:metal-dependent hydrolase n=1 Tax=unclassified Cohnella TaxID=2636738 RepID=UPI00363C111C
MDTCSHLLFGASLAAMAQLHPSVAADPYLSAAVLTATLAGSHAPDLDSVVRLKSMEAYWKYHRSWTHSIPAWFGWAALIGGASAWLWGSGASFWLLFAVSLAAVSVHVLFDWTNAYGVQFLLPWHKQWLHLDALCLTDPWLAALHATVATGWFAGWWPDVGIAGAVAWVVTVLYAVWRISHHRRMVAKLKRRFRRWRSVHVLPGLWWFRWQFAAQTEEGFELGWIVGDRIVTTRKLPPSMPHPCVDASLGVPSVRTLNDFAKRKYVTWTMGADGRYTVTWTDVRFWREREWPYRAEVVLDQQLNVLAHRIGWHKRAWQYPYV